MLITTAENFLKKLASKRNAPPVKCLKSRGEHWYPVYPQYRSLHPFSQGKKSTGMFYQQRHLSEGILSNAISNTVLTN